MLNEGIVVVPLRTLRIPKFSARLLGLSKGAVETDMTGPITGDPNEVRTIVKRDLEGS